MSSVEIRVFDFNHEELIHYFAPSVPREGEKFTTNGIMYEVVKVIWKAEDFEVAARVQVEEVEH